MRARGMVGTALLLCLVAETADAATWVRYGFTGTGTAFYTGLGAPLGVTRSVTFSGVAYADLDLHVRDDAQPWWSNGGSAFLGYNTLSSIPASAAAGAAGTVFTLNDFGIGGGVQNWTVTALTADAEGSLPGVSGTQAASGAASFRVGNGLSLYDGTGRVSALSVTRVDAPGAWSFSVSPGPIPEPATWLTVLVGFALLGAGLRYRGRRARVTFG